MITFHPAYLLRQVSKKVFLDRFEKNKKKN